MFAGITVCIALLGMFALGVSFLYGVAVAASIAVLCTVAAALTLLPALLGFFGRRALGRRARRSLTAGQLTTTDESPGWARWARTLSARPALIAAAAAAALMVIIALPFFSMRLGSADAGSTRQGAPPARPTTCSPRASGPATTARCNSSPQSTTPPRRRRSRTVADRGREDERRRAGHDAES